MSHQVLWTKLILEEFIKDASLTKLQESIMRTRAAGWTRVQQSLYFNVSLSVVDRNIKILKIKYDQVQKTNPILPPRKHSAAETYMDKN